MDGFLTEPKCSGQCAESLELIQLDWSCWKDTAWRSTFDQRIKSFHGVVIRGGKENILLTFIGITVIKEPLCAAVEAAISFLPLRLIFLDVCCELASLVSCVWDYGCHRFLLHGYPAILLCHFASWVSCFMASLKSSLQHFYQHSIIYLLWLFTSPDFTI